MVGTCVIAMTSLHAAQLIGSMGVILCVVMFASPLVAMKTVLETKVATSIPLPFTIGTIVNCFCWSATGWFLMEDRNIYIPNLLGLFFGLVQVALKLIYGNGKPVEPTSLPI